MMLGVILAEAPPPAPTGNSIWVEIGGALLVAFLGGLAGAYITNHLSRRESQRQRLRDLQRDFFAGSMLEARLRAERLLLDRKEALKGSNLKEMYEGKLSFDEYKDIAVVLNLFRLLNAYKESGYINEAEARDEFGWAYRWWWENVFEPYSANIKDDPDWQPHIRKHDWLLGPRKAVSR